MRKRKEKKISAEPELCCSREHTHSHIQQQAHVNHTVGGDRPPIGTRQRHRAAQRIHSINKQTEECTRDRMHVHKQRKLFASVFVLKLESFKLVSSVGDAVKNDIIVSQGDFFFFFSSSFFSLHVRAFCLEKSGAIHFTSLLCSRFPSFGKLFSF